MACKVDETTWRNMGWPERLVLLKQLLGLPTNTELAKMMSVTVRTVYSWFNGTITPSKEHAENMRRVCVDMLPSEPSIAMVGAVTMSIDAAGDLYEMAIRTKNPMALYLSVSSILIKHAHCLMSIHQLPIVPTVEFLYGSFPAKGRLTLRIARMPEFTAVLTASHTKDEPMEFHCMTEIFWNGTKDRTFMFVCSDTSVDETCMRITAYIKNKAKHYTPKDV